MTENDFLDPKFDEMLQNADLPTPSIDVADAMQPWRTAMNRILWSLALSSVTLNLWCLNHILPCIAIVLSVLGYRALQKENKFFAAAYTLSWVRVVWELFLLFTNATVFRAEITSSAAYGILRWLLFAVSFAMLLCLRNGIKAVQIKAGLEPDVKGATAMIVWYMALTVMALLSLGGVFVWVFLFAFCFTLRSLYKCSRLLDEAGYAITPAPRRVPDWILKLGYALAVILSLATGYLFFSRYPMDWQPVTPPQSANVQQIRSELLELGFPEDVLNDLTEAEILDCSGAVTVIANESHDALNGGRRVTTQTENQIYIETVYDVYELKTVSVAVLLSDEREHWKIFHHFEWTVNPNYYGTECITLWDMDAQTNCGWMTDRNYSGRVLYDRDGVTYTAPFYEMGKVSHENNALFSSLFSQSTSYLIRFNFSFREGGRRYRSYICYDIRETTSGALINSTGNYCHQSHMLQFPVQTAYEGGQIFIGDYLNVFFDTFYQLLFRSPRDEAE